MRASEEPRSLIVLAADKHIKASLETLLERRRTDLAIGDITFEVYRHPQSDPGCRTKAAEFLRSFIRQYRYALVVFDWDGCGSKSAPESIQAAVEQDLGRNGWKERSKVVVISPEVETWVWSSSEQVAQALGWAEGLGRLRSWLEDRGLWSAGDLKPADPKKAMGQALRHRSRVRSSALFSDLAASVEFERCGDRAFKELIGTLQTWFPRSKAA